MPANSRSSSQSSMSCRSDATGLTDYSKSSDSDFAQKYQENLNYELQREITGQSTYRDVQENDALLPQENTPGVATDALLERGLQIPSRTRLLTSGFPYYESLSKYTVSESDWTRFTSEITSASKMTRKQWTMAVGKGAGVFVAGGLFIGFLSAVPAAHITKQVRQRLENENLRKAIDSDSAELQRVIRQWNEDFFTPKGLLVRVDLPGDAEDMSTMDISDSMEKSDATGSKRKGSRVDEHSPSRQDQRQDEKVREKASRRGRIVILPLDARSSSVSNRSMTSS